MIITLENLRNRLYSSPLGGNLFERWCLLNYLRDLYEQTGCMGPEYDYIRGFYPPEEYDTRHFFSLHISHKNNFGTLYVYKHLSYTTYYRAGNFCHYSGREIYHEDIEYQDSKSRVDFFNPLEFSECVPFDLEKAKEKMDAKEIIITKDTCEVHYTYGLRTIDCFSKKLNGEDTFSRESLEAQNPLLAKYYHGKGSWTSRECFLEDTW